MIQIDDLDLPITVAEKLINAKKPSSIFLPEFLQAMLDIKQSEKTEVDMFDDDDLREIAYHILLYLGEMPVGREKEE